MTEKYLHLIWKTKRLPFHNLKTTDGNKIEILHVGTYNLASGPDFFNGQINISGIKISGNIEIHVKSSDWYLHKHQNDKAYDNVILHVVYEHDLELIINNRTIPTIELKKLIDWNHFHTTNSNSKLVSRIPCEKSFELANELLIWSQFEQALIERLNRKIDDLYLLCANLNNPKKAFFISLAQTFGMKVNSLPFIELAIRLPLESWLNLSLNEKLISLLGLAGLEKYLSPESLLEWKFMKHKYLLKEMNLQSWKSKGLRPAGFPLNRIIQFTLFCHHFLMDFSLFDQDAISIVDTIKKVQHTTSKETDSTHLFNCSINININDEMINLILTNTIVPFIQLYKGYRGKEHQLSISIDLLENTKYESNSIINYWKKLGVKVKSAADSQALIEQFNNKCLKKKCMNCQISRVILN